MHYGITRLNFTIVQHLVSSGAILVCFDMFSCICAESILVGLCVCMPSILGLIPHLLPVAGFNNQKPPVPPPLSFQLDEKLLGCCEIYFEVALP